MSSDFLPMKVGSRSHLGSLRTECMYVNRVHVRYVTYVSYVTLQLTLRYVPPDSALTYVRSLRARPSALQQPHRSVAYLLHVATQASSTEPQEQSSEPQIMPATAQRARGYFKKYSYIFIRIGPRAVAIHTRTEQARMQHYHQNRCLPCRVRAGRPMPSGPIGSARISQSQTPSLCGS